MQLEVSTRLLHMHVMNSIVPREHICESAAAKTTSPAPLVGSIRRGRRRVVMSRKFAFEMRRMQHLLGAFFQKEENHHEARNCTTRVGDPDLAEDKLVTLIRWLQAKIRGIQWSIYATDVTTVGETELALGDGAWTGRIVVRFVFV